MIHEDGIGLETGRWSLSAYRLNESALPVVPASVRREWMDRTARRFATRCLPMTMANQAGWFILNTYAVRVIWSGGAGRDAIRIEYARRPPANLPIVSYFGHGIVTWRIGLLFRTPAGFDLCVRGPANWPKAGAYPLEGIVETNWSVAPFTMNWKLLVQDEPVVFDEGEPIAMVAPMRTGDLELFVAHVSPIAHDAELMKAYNAWNEERLRFVLERKGSEFPNHYTRGRAAGDVVAQEHRTRLKVRQFEEKGTTTAGIDIGTEA